MTKLAASIRRLLRRSFAEQVGFCEAKKKGLAEAKPLNSLVGRE